MTKPRLTVVTPSFNQARFIDRTVRSVLDQSIDSLEYIVCDGGSTDGTTDILQHYDGRLRWISERDDGQADAVNKGISLTSGDLIGWLNSDDIYYPGVLAYVCTFFEEHPDVQIAYGDANHIDESEKVIEPYYTENWDYERLKSVCFISQPSVFFRRSLVQKYGLVDASLRYCMDYEYWLRIGATTPFVRLPLTVAGSRLYRTNKTLGDRVAVHEEINNMLRRRLGEVPSRWLYNYAFAAYDGKGWQRRDLHRHAWFFARTLVGAHLRWGSSVPPSVFRTISGWYWETWRAARNARAER